MKYIVTNGQDPDFVQLCNELDDFLNREAGGEQNRAEYVPLNARDGIKEVILFYDGEVPIGCGSYKLLSPEQAEMKRVFVREQYRNLGIARKILQSLENIAFKNGVTTLVVETGIEMKPAVSLYKSLGYEKIPNYGEYKNMPKSICLQKKISNL